ncbi:hypothetical protein ASV53_02515 [Photobacterium sanguinicancri]|uniref:Lipocalin-like domain-containing protein n=1 Tax=Photobacterium sanguinicancri TaxID=875932 RepID=A0ABX4G3B9_9GAMM|nr:hypothetical protein ASV53_02515 [Photobacterium sanguinicancri]
MHYIYHEFRGGLGLLSKVIKHKLGDLVDYKVKKILILSLITATSGCNWNSNDDDKSSKDSELKSLAGRWVNQCQAGFIINNNIPVNGRFILTTLDFAGSQLEVTQQTFTSDNCDNNPLWQQKDVYSIEIGAKYKLQSEEMVSNIDITYSGDVNKTTRYDIYSLDNNRGRAQLKLGVATSQNDGRNSDGRFEVLGDTYHKI